MPNKKKIILFIVEGINDKTNLALCLSRLFENEEIRFEITQGDITTKSGVSSVNINAKIGNIVKKHSGRIFKQSDYLEVVHLIDTDGAFIPDENVIETETDNIIYEAEEIYCHDVSAIRNRNHQKQEIIRKMLTITKVWTNIPYRVYYFSCNMDHVLHKQANLSRKEKDNCARRFESRYMDKPQEFVQFFNEEQLYTAKTFDESWNYIQQGTNSLKRKTNFSLYMKEKSLPFH